MRNPIRPGRPLRRAVAALLGAAFGLLTAGALSAPASADFSFRQLAPAPDCKSVSASIADRPDSAVGGYDWAKDDFDRTAKVCVIDKHDQAPAAKVVEVQSWTYGIVGDDSGVFTTMGVKSPQSGGVAQLTGLNGKMHGHWSLRFEAPADWLGFTAPTSTNKLSTSEWIKALWKDGFKPNEFVDWKWIYNLCNEVWINASAKLGGNHGNITGTSRIPCYGNPSFTSKCDGTVIVLLTNAAPSSTNLAVYWVSGVSAHSGFVAVPGGKPGQVSVVASPDTKGVVTVKYGLGDKKTTKTYTYDKPKACTSPSPSTSVPGGAGNSTPPVTGLPVTGVNTTAAVVGGSALLLAGAGAVLLARRRRVRFEA